MPLYTHAQLLELIQLKLLEGMTPTELLLFLHANGLKSFTGKDFTIGTLLTTLKTIQNPSFRPSSVVAQLLKARA